jgi:hypothetical protein
MRACRAVHAAHVVGPVRSIEIFVGIKEVTGVDATAVVPLILAAIEPYRPIMPVGPPVMPAPSVTAEVSEVESNAEHNPGPIKVEVRIGIPARPERHRRAVHERRIVFGHVHHTGIGWQDADQSTIVRDRLLLVGLQVTRRAGSLPHRLDGRHHLLWLAPVGIAKR